MGLCAGKRLRSLGAPGAEGVFGYSFMCPGCEHAHVVWTRERPGGGHVWQFDGNEAAPTFAPSLLVQYDRHVPPVTEQNYEEWKKNPWPQTKVHEVCHSFIREGYIQFLGDCTHRLANQTVPLPEWDE